MTPLTVSVSCWARMSSRRLWKERVTRRDSSRSAPKSEAAVQKSGFVVRFVDVVLILLFGFISISSVRATEIQLPESTETLSPPPEIEDVVFVAIRTDGTYLVDDERVEIRGARNLLAWVRAEVDTMGDIPVKVRIRASHDTPMRYLVDAARVCDELGVDKALEVLMAVGG